MQTTGATPQVAPVTLPSPANVAQRPPIAATPPTVTMGDCRGLAKAAAAAAAAADASREWQIAYEIEPEKIAADRKCRQAAEREQRALEALHRANVPTVRQPPPPHAVGSTRYGVPEVGPPRFWRLSADHTI